MIWRVIELSELYPLIKWISLERRYAHLQMIFLTINNRGYLIIGADDKTGKVMPIDISDRILQKVASIRTEGNIQPSTINGS